MVEISQCALILVLERVPQKYRFKSCARVSRSWADAALASTTTVQARCNRQSVPSLFRWISTHGTFLNSINIHNGHQQMLTKLPCPALRDLELCNIMVRLELSLESGQLVLLEAATGLTRLSFRAVTACGNPERLMALTALSSLQDLSVDSTGKDVSPAYHQPHLLYLPSELLLQLTQLQRLSVKPAVADGGAPLQLSSLVKLPALELSLAVPSKGAAPPSWQQSAAVLSALQQLTQLTGLRLEEVRGPLDSDNTPWISALTALQHMEVDSYRTVDLGLLRPLTSLQTLEISFTSPSEFDVLEDTIVWPPHQQRLRHLTSLQLTHTECLSTSSELSSLVYCCPALQSLGLHCDEAYGLELLALQELKSLTQLSVCVASEPIAAAVLTQLTGLQDLSVTYEGYFGPRGLLPLTALCQLTRLAFKSLPGTASSKYAAEHYFVNKVCLPAPESMTMLNASSIWSIRAEQRTIRQSVLHHRYVGMLARSSSGVHTRTCHRVSRMMVAQVAEAVRPSGCCQQAVCCGACACVSAWSALPLHTQLLLPPSPQTVIARAITTLVLLLLPLFILSLQARVGQQPNVCLQIRAWAEPIWAFCSMNNFPGPKRKKH